MKLKDVVVLADLAKETNIPVTTLRDRLKHPGFKMVEGEDFRRLGPRMPILLSPIGVKKITVKETLQSIVKGELDKPIEALSDLLKEGILTKERFIALPVPPKMHGLVMEKLKSEDAE